MTPGKLTFEIFKKLDLVFYKQNINFMVFQKVPTRNKNFCKCIRKPEGASIKSFGISASTIPHMWSINFQIWNVIKI